MLTMIRRSRKLEVLGAWIRRERQVAGVSCPGREGLCLLRLCVLPDGWEDVADVGYVPERYEGVRLKEGVR